MSSHTIRMISTIRKFWSAVVSTIFCILTPARFERRAKEDDAALKAELTRRAFGSSALLTSFALVVGFLVGSALRSTVGPLSTSVAKPLQLLSAGLILVATLAPLGFDIDTWTRETLVEKVNRWLVQSLFLFGTLLLALSLGWTQ
jgi:predicted Co/Zn/Cd cation transporter (cation efflux family)